jgi:arylsulfatase A-like enzyme
VRKRLLPELFAVAGGGLIAGFVIGCFVAGSKIYLSGFLSQRMPRMALLTASQALRYWPFVCLSLALASYVAFRLASPLVMRLPGLGALPRRIGRAPKLRVALVVATCLLVILVIGWVMNRYYLPYELHPLSLAADALLILSVATVGVIVLKVPRERLVSSTGLRIAAGCALAFAVLLNLAVVLDLRLAQAGRPNLIIVLADTLRRDHLGCYGYERDTSPNIDRFSARSRLYRNAFSQSPSTKSSVAALFTSKYPSQHGTIENDHFLKLSHVTLAEVLRENRYRTAGFIENPVVSSVFGYDQGFSRWELDDRRHVGTDEPMDELDEKIHHWIARHSDETFFLYVHYIDPHSPYRAPGSSYRPPDTASSEQKPGDITRIKDPAFFEQNPAALSQLVSLYDDEIRYIDSRFGGIVEKLENLGILDNTVVIFLSDHGEGFLEHGYLRHSRSVYSELIDVPLLIHSPRELESGTDDSLVQLADVFPTVLRLLGVSRNGLSLSGRDLASASPEPSGSDVRIFVEHLRRDWGVRQQGMIRNDWKLVRDIDRPRVQLFNRRSDPGDRNDLAAEEVEIAGQMERELLTWHGLLDDVEEASEVELTDEMIERLRSLGYIE